MPVSPETITFELDVKDALIGRLYRELFISETEKRQLNERIGQLEAAAAEEEPDGADG